MCSCGSVFLISKEIHVRFMSQTLLVDSHRMVKDRYFQQWCFETHSHARLLQNRCSLFIIYRFRVDWWVTSDQIPAQPRIVLYKFTSFIFLYPSLRKNKRPNQKPDTLFMWPPRFTNIAWVDTNYKIHEWMDNRSPARLKVCYTHTLFTPGSSDSQEWCIFVS